MIRKSLFILFAFLSVKFIPSVYASDNRAPENYTLEKCTIGNYPDLKPDRSCLIDQILQNAQKIENQNWKDQTYREAAKTLTADGNINKAINILDLIENPDIKALTIRGIGMEVQKLNLAKEKRSTVFAALRNKTETIKHPPSYSIALTYIAMAQTFSGDKFEAFDTARSIKNNALRNKAFNETAEILAKQGEYKWAMGAIMEIESESFRNKAYEATSKIWIDNGYFASALGFATHITNPYKKAKAIQYILDAENNDKKEVQ